MNPGEVAFVVVISIIFVGLMYLILTLKPVADDINPNHCPASRRLERELMGRY